MKKQMFVMLVSILLFSDIAYSIQEQIQEIVTSTKGTDYKIVGEKHFISGYEAMNQDGDVNVIVEIPAGTTAKWEVSKSKGIMEWEVKDGKHRIVQYLGYPGNYGFIPGTLLSKKLGGDGDPLDIIVLGAAVPRGSILKVKLLGVLRFLDRGEQDDKLVAVHKGSPFYNVSTFSELDQNFAGVLLIIRTWFSNYKGPGKMEFKGFGSLDDAKNILNLSIESFNKVEQERK